MDFRQIRMLRKMQPIIACENIVFRKRNICASKLTESDDPSGKATYRLFRLTVGGWLIVVESSLASAMLPHKITTKIVSTCLSKLFILNARSTRQVLAKE